MLLVVHDWDAARQEGLFKKAPKKEGATCSKVNSHGESRKLKSSTGRKSSWD